MSRKELTWVTLLASIGVVASAVIHPYDTVSWKAAGVLTLLSGVVTAGLFWVGLGVGALSPGRRVAGAVWSAVSWHILLLNQIPYLGFLFLPVEVVIASAILQRRARVETLWTAVSVAAVVRVASLGIAYATVRPIRQLFSQG